MSQKENSLKWREHNLFTKKVPRDAEAANIQVRGSIRERSCPHHLFAGCYNPIDLSTTGCIHKTELSCAPRGFLRDQKAHSVSSLVVGSPLQLEPRWWPLAEPLELS